MGRRAEEEMNKESGRIEDRAADFYVKNRESLRDIPLLAAFAESEIARAKEETK